MDGSHLKRQEKAGLVIMGLDYASLTLSLERGGFLLSLAFCEKAHQGYSEEKVETRSLSTGNVFLRTLFTEDGKCRFAYSIDEETYIEIGESFQAREGRWIGAKIGLFVLAGQETGLKGYTDFDWFRIE
jgi:hypothetical protein